MIYFLIKFSVSNFSMMLDQSSGHGKMRQGALSMNSMNVTWGGNQNKLRTITIKEVGPYRTLLGIGGKQKMYFEEGDQEPFTYLIIIN